MSDKKTILVLADDIRTPSGVGSQTKYFIDSLIKTGRYKFICFGGAIKHQNYNPVKTEEFGDDWIMYPVDSYGTPELVRSLIVVREKALGRCHNVLDGVPHPGVKVELGAVKVKKVRDEARREHSACKLDHGDRGRLAGALVLNNDLSQISQQALRPEILQLKRNYPVGVLQGAVSLERHSEPLRPQFF